MSRWMAVRLLLGALWACLLVVLLGSSSFAVAPSPAPGAPGGTGVTAWRCEPGSTPVPTTSPSPVTLGTTAVPSVYPSPFGSECAATSYSGPVPPVSVQVSTAPVQVSGWPECSQVGLSVAGQATPSPAPSPSQLHPGSVIGRDCALQADLGRRQSFALWLFLGALVALGVAGAVLRMGRGFRG